ncbi:MAG: GDP-mannose 4,6-dehydratase [Pseudomonadota bacterium]|nr:GDP-mannose 4,6-dehydratase [Pseudomonadota bacterium]
MLKAIITGITGQDGAYLASLLLTKGYVVYGTYRHSASNNFWRLHELNLFEHANFNLVKHDLNDLSTCIRLINDCNPDEIYNLAAQSFVGTSFDQPVLTAQTNALGPVNILEAIRICNRNIKFYQASTSEMFGLVQETPQSETTSFYPRSPYGCAKLYAHWITINYRESYGMFATSGILFNHESPLRGLEFITRKLTYGLSQVKLGKQPYVEVGNIHAKRDWGYAKDYVKGMWQMLQADEPDNYVLATGKTETIKNFIELTCQCLEIDIGWQGSGMNEIGIDTKNGQTIVKINPRFYRPAEVDILQGNATKAYTKLGWKAETNLKELCAIMVEADIKRAKQEKNAQFID